ncbi:hypothetical protein BH10BAC1_BH10BAC1_14410 [soil metagenome]
MKNTILILLFFFSFSAKSHGQSTPQELSKAVLNSLLNYNEEKLKLLISADPEEQKIILEKLKQISSTDLKHLKGSKTLSSSTRAVLKDGDKDYKERADIFIIITDNKELKYELKLWGCGKLNEKWVLGNKIESEKVAVF